MATETAPKKNYKETLNLPQTGFPMEAKLTQNEPKRLEKWQQAGLYRQILDSRKDAQKWILHDGPPFANGDIHIGHLINKTLKDVILRFRTMQGYQTPYVPGWDCHGLPIEHKIQQDLGPKLREMSTLDVRKRCFAYADKYVGIQSTQFQRLGILGEWDNPYLTMAPSYEASTLEVFAKIVEKGLVYRKLKPVPWSVANQTALADAELEYQDVTDSSVYVEFPALLGGNPFGKARPEHFSYLVWTTTPWTLPANLAIAFNSEVDYALVEYTRSGVRKFGVVAAALVEKVFAGRPCIENYSVVDSVSGDGFVRLEYRHPFLDRVGKLVEADYVTTEDGTGLVHTAPGHGEEDYETGIREGLPVYSPVMYNGRFDDTVPEWLRGKTVWEANPIITQKLVDLGLLLAEQKITHSYPHDWRSKTPIIFRATEQWFVAMDQPYQEHGNISLRERAISAVRDKIDFVPEWGRHRMMGMLQSRPDWCISRQRAWGLPIPVFYNEKGDALLTPESVRAVAKRFGEKGSDAWFTDSPAELLGPDFKYPTGFSPENLRKEKDIFDVWFESGSSWHAVLQGRPYLQFPADLYLEGSDQHRGWFQLSLLPALGATGEPPFKQVLTHGFVVKPDGTKVSKSDKEYVKAVDEINRHGADLLRLWCCSVDYQNDVPTSPKSIQEFGDKYRKIRNTLRYLLANLYDFNPATDSVEVPLNSLDGWAFAELDTLIRDVTDAYENYQLHRVFRLLHDFCAVQLSSVYGNAMKDRLYCELPSAPLRRRTQTVLHRMVLAITKLLAPMVVFTADEAWEHISHKPADEAGLPSVHMARLPEPSSVEVSDEQRAGWQKLFELRDAALLQLDALKKDVGLNKASEAEVIYTVTDEPMRRKLQAYGVDLEDLVGAGFHSFADRCGDGPAISVKVVDRRDTYPACARSWKRRPDVGQDPDFPDLSLRDAAAVRSLR
ncbi:MAG TPA: isoleucine--tRNA ligase [Tepidisphaeraceae bacterium]|nr:isoleucine--tRNA ligase [Tepidisphaeraceae bacterium]